METAWRCAACGAAVDEAHSEPVSFGSGRRCETCSRRRAALSAALCHTPPPVRPRIDFDALAPVIVCCAIALAALFVIALLYIVSL